jgi:transposase
MKSFSSTEQNRVLTLLKSGATYATITAKTGASKATISRLRSKHCPDLPKSPGGRPAKLTAANIAYAKRLVRMGKVDNAVQVTKALVNVTNEPLSAQTVRRGLRKAGLRPVVKKKRPALKLRHRKARLGFALEHKEKTLEDWKRVLVSDETKINRLGSDGRKWVWKEVGEGLSDRLVEGTTKFGGGSVMVWGCMCWDGIGYAERIEGKMNAEMYCGILERQLLETMEYYGKSPSDTIFQQDNDPKHTSKMAQRWFEEHGIEVMRWPAQSPDLNPIEHLWHYLKQRLDEYEYPPQGQEELWERVDREWNKIDKSVCQNLIESMPRRLEAVIKAKGGYTKY